VTSLACPICKADDVTKQWSACENSLQTSTVLYNRICVDPNNMGRAEAPLPCQAIVLNRTSAIFGLVGVGVALLVGAAIAGYCWYTKREVEIKYARLRTDMNLDSDDEMGEDRLHQLPSTQIGLDGDSSDDNNGTLFSSEDTPTQTPLEEDKGQ